jgi:hypothetical protein
MIDALVLEVTGIVVSGVVGPVVVAYAVTSGDRRRLVEQEAEDDRDDLLKVLEESGSLLGSIAVGIQQLAADTRAAMPSELHDLTSRLYLIRERLLFRLRPDGPIVESLDRILDVLKELDVAEAPDYRALETKFDPVHVTFLDICRTELATRNFIVERKGRRRRT